MKTAHQDAFSYKSLVCRRTVDFHFLLFCFYLTTFLNAYVVFWKNRKY